MSYCRIAFILSITLLLPLTLRAAGPTIVLDIPFHSVEIRPGNDRTIIDFDDTVKDLQAMRIQRNNTYYVVVLHWQDDVAKLLLYDTAGQQLTKRKAIKAPNGKDLTVLRLTVVAINGEERIQVEAIKTNDQGQPNKWLKKQFAILPTEDTVFPLRSSSHTDITYPDTTSMSDPEAGMATLNYQRLAAGLFPVNRSSTLDHGCSVHAEYMRLNDELTHYEEEGQPGYTTEGDTAGGASLVTKQTSGSMTQSIDILMQAIYHRIQMIDNYNQVVGYAISSPSASGFRYGCLYLGGVPDTIGQSYGSENNITYSDLGSHYPIVSPGVKEIAVTPIVTTGEYPDPVAPFGGDLPYGYPISIGFPEIYTVTDVTMQVLHPNGQPLAVYFRAPDDSADPNYMYQGNTAWLIPQAPLAHNTTYTVKVSAKYNKQTFTKQWQFTTD